LTEMLTHPNDEISTLDNINNQFGNWVCHSKFRRLLDGIWLTWVKGQGPTLKVNEKLDKSVVRERREDKC
jgi:hypothetical protein